MTALSLSDLVVVVVPCAKSYLPLISSPKKDFYIMHVVPFIPYCLFVLEKNLHYPHRIGGNLELSRESSNTDRYALK